MQNSRESRILYVDDYQACDKLIDALLYAEKFNCNLTLANTPREALRLIEKSQFDLYVIESNLPEMNGSALCRQIRKIDRNTPILFLTKAAPSFEQMTSIVSGAIEYLAKPHDSSNIAKIIKTLLNKKSLPEMA